MAFSVMCQVSLVLYCMVYYKLQSSKHSDILHNSNPITNYQLEDIQTTELDLHGI